MVKSMGLKIELKKFVIVLIHITQLGKQAARGL